MVWHEYFGRKTKRTPQKLHTILQTTIPVSIFLLFLYALALYTHLSIKFILQNPTYSIAMQFDGWSLTRARIKTNSYEFCVLVYYYITLLYTTHIYYTHTPIIPLASYNYPGKIQKRREHCVYFIYYLFVLLGYNTEW